MILFDGRGTPGLRTVLGRALSESTVASIAIRRIRLARVDLTPQELGGLTRCRVLLGRLDAEALASPLTSRSPAGTAALLDMAASGRLEVRSAALLSWDPDFALIGHGSADTDSLLFGSIQFVPQGPADDVSLACALRDPVIARTAALRFEELWERGHDTLEAITDALCRSRSALDG